MSNNPYLEIDQKMLGDIYSSAEIWNNLRRLCDDFGSRFGGTDGERQAASFLSEKMKSYGLEDVHEEPVEYTGWKRGEAALEILEPFRKTIPCISLPHSPPSQLEGTLVDVWEGSPREFGERASEIEDKILLTSSMVSPPGVQRWIHRNEKLGRGILAGAKGFLFVNHYPGYGPPTGGIGHRGKPALIPGLGLSFEEGAYLRRLVKEHGEVKVRIKTTDEFFPAISWNVIGELPGYGDEVVMVGCHYDGHDISQGAQDPASGTAAVLEAARVLSRYGGERFCTLRIAFWGVEEIGLLGSTAYVEAHAADLDRIRFYFNMDAAGAIKIKDVVLNEWPALAPLFKNWSDEMAHPYQVGQSVNAHSDHFPFLLRGVPTAGMQTIQRDTGGRGYGHTAYDTLDKVELADLREAAALAGRLLIRVANVENWPAQRRDEAAVEALFHEAQYQDEAEFRSALAAYYVEHAG